MPCSPRFFQKDQPPLVNIGFGEDITIRDLALLICRLAKFEGELTFDATKPDGTPRKLLDSTRIAQLGWQPKIALETGVAEVIQLVRDRMARGDIIPA